MDKLWGPILCFHVPSAVQLQCCFAVKLQKDLWATKLYFLGEKFCFKNGFHPTGSTEETTKWACIKMDSIDLILNLIWLLYIVFFKCSNSRSYLLPWVQPDFTLCLWTTPAAGGQEWPLCHLGIWYLLTQSDQLLTCSLEVSVNFGLWETCMCWSNTNYRGSQMCI